LPSGRRTATLQLDVYRRGEFEEPPRHVVFSPDGRLVITADHEGLLNAIDANDWRLLDTFDAEVGDCRWVEVAPDGNTIALCGQDETVRLFSLNPRRAIGVLTGGSAGYNSLAFSPDGKRLAAGTSEILRVWELDEYRPVAGIEWPQDVIARVRFLKGSDALIAAGAWFLRILRAPRLHEIDSEYRASAEAGRADQVSSVAPISHPGAIPDWLLMGPVTMESQDDDPLNREWLLGERQLQPSADNEATLGGVRFPWRQCSAPDGILELSGTTARPESSIQVAYAVCYLVSERPLQDCVVEVGSEEEYRLYLNGTPVIEYAWRMIGSQKGPRIYPVVKDRMSGIALRAGVNVLVLKIVTETGQWTGSVKVSDPRGDPLPGVRITTAP